MRIRGLNALLFVFWALCLTGEAAAVPGSEEAWIFLERNRPEDALARCSDEESFLCHWVAALAELRVGLEPSDSHSSSKAARAFEEENFTEAELVLEPMLAGSFSEADALQIRLHLGASLEGLGQYTQAEKLLTPVIELARKQGRHASRCYGLLLRGRLKAGLHQYDFAQADLQAALNLCRRLETHNWAGAAALAMSDLHKKKKNFEDAVYWSEAALGFFRHGGNIKGQVQALQLVGEGLCALDECSEGLTFLEEARALAHQHGITLIEVGR